MATLYLVTTPIGNLEDLSSRAQRIISKEKLFLAEDTRVFKSLCEHLGVDLKDKRVFSFNDHDQNKVDGFVALLENGEDLVLVSDAGSPIISDPAFPMVQKAIELGHQVESIPGVSSVVVALELSGLAPHPFTFHGFFPRDSKKQKEMIERLLNQGQTHILFESPHRIIETIDILSKDLENWSFSVARELTKKFQEVIRFKSEQWPLYRERLTVKGEFVIVLHGESTVEGFQLGSEVKALAQSVLERNDPKNLSKLLSSILGTKSKEIYQLLIDQKAKS